MREELNKTKNHEEANETHEKKNDGKTRYCFIFHFRRKRTKKPSTLKFICNAFDKIEGATYTSVFKRLRLGVELQEMVDESCKPDFTLSHCVKKLIVHAYFTQKAPKVCFKCDIS